MAQQLSPEESKMMTGNIAGIAFVAVIAFVITYLIVDKIFCHLLNYC